MAKMKRLLEEIANCETCEGKGIDNYWVSPDGDYDFEWCDCNPEHLIPAENF
jgi:hypothetical protein